MTITQKQRKKISVLAQQFDLELVILFGSQARGTPHARSDVDIAVLAQTRKEFAFKQRFQIQMKLEEIIGMPVDLVDLADAPILLGDRITRDGEVLFGNYRQFQRLRDKLHIRYMDYAPYFELQQKKLFEHFGVAV